jgi:uncharacterized protein (TIGR04255 family)
VEVPTASPDSSALAERRSYNRPPIVEATIDIQAENPAEIDLDILNRVRAGEERKYPQREDLFQGTFTLKIGPEPPTSSQAHTGYRISTQDRTRIVQIRLNGMSCSKLQPYTSWEENRDEAKRFWDKYVEVVHPIAVTRIAVRYINRIRLPAGGLDLTEYFGVRPEIPVSMPHTINNFALRLELPQPSLENGMLILNEGTVPDPETGGLAFLLDLDVFQLVRLPTAGDLLWERLELLHERENTLFEQSVTNKTRALFD